MPKVYNLFTFTLLYYQLDYIAKPLLYDKLSIFNNTTDSIILTDISALNNDSVFTSINIFILLLMGLFIIQFIFLSNINNYTIHSLLFIYVKYTVDNLIQPFNSTLICQYEFRRSLMWLFTTPLILKLYCDINNLTFKEINAYTHLASNMGYIVLYPFRNSFYNCYILLLLCLLECIFINKLYYLKDKKYTMFIIYIWSLFSFLTMNDVLHIFHKMDIQICFLLADLIAKLGVLLIVYDNENRIFYIKQNVDLQCVSLLTNVKKSIQQFENNQKITNKCNSLITQLNHSFKNLIPTDTSTLKLELLKKILPLELEDNYLMHNKEYKDFNFVCVLFTDIVSYTELAKNYEADIMYKLLNEVYTLFDSIILRYPILQKIETIGDAYMVVSDIYTNNQTDNVKNVVLFALDILKEVSKIKTPNNKPLQLRIGINLGKVVVGILGVEIPRLCVIGNTVNVANRLQTTTEPNTIQISTHVYEKIKDIEFEDELNYEKKEEIFLKNLGSRTTYIITPPIKIIRDDNT